MQERDERIAFMSKAYPSQVFLEFRIKS